MPRLFTTADVVERIVAVPTVTIDTEGAAPIVSKDDYLNATVSVTGVPGVADFAGAVQIKGRGNSTWGMPKKPYKLKFAANTSLMGLPVHKTWALLANYADETGINYGLALTMGALTEGLAWTPRFDYADLYLNGAYNGQYQLTELVEFGVDRVNATKASGTTGLPVTGAYLMEATGQALEAGEIAFPSEHLSCDFLFKDPDAPSATLLAYMTGWMQDAEDVLYGVDWLNSTTGYRSKFDTAALASWYLMEELGRNAESMLGSSAKFYKTRDTVGTAGKLVMGPLWDFDYAFGLRDAGPTLSPRGVGVSSSGWPSRMLQDPDFLAELAEQWLAFKANVATAGGFDAIVDDLIDRVQTNGPADATRWGYSEDWEVDRALKKYWINARVAWMDEYLGTDFSTVGDLVTANV